MSDKLEPYPYAAATAQALELDALRAESEHLKLWLDDHERSLLELRAEDERRRQDAARAQAVVDDLDVPEVIRWVEAVTLQPRVSLPASVYDALRAETATLRQALTEISELDLEGDASLADALRIADEALNP